MKLIIKLADDIIKGIRGENDCKVEPREIVRSFQATIADAIKNGIPYNSTDDRISREQVLKELMAHQYSQDFCKEHGIDYSINSSMVRIVVRECPPVELDTSEIEYNAYCKGLKHGKKLARPVGEWICTLHSTFPQYQPDEYRCSVCNGLGNKFYSFCPKCGADMGDGAECPMK